MSKEIPLSQDKVAIVDDEDFNRVSQYSWHYVRGYAKAFDKGTGSNRKLYLHRVVMGLGHFVDDQREIDHINHNGLDNRKTNLEIKSRSGNMLNRKHTIRDGFSSKYRGVAHRGGRTMQFRNRHGTLTTPSKSWTTYYGKRYIGIFETEEKAAKCRDLAALRAEGPHAQLNFPITGLEDL